MSDFSSLSDKELLDLYQTKRNQESTYDAMQMALKTSLNSAYGAQANQHFRYYSTDIAEGITMTGQFTIQFISKVLNDFLNDKLKTNEDYVVANDTDSAYIRLDRLVDKVVPAATETSKVIDFLDKFVSTVIEPLIAKKYAELADYVNAIENRMSMKREAISDRAIWRAKKNYILQVYDNEGVRYNEPKLKTVGIETARSSTPGLVRKALEGSYKILLNQPEENLHRYVKDFKDRFMQADIADIAFPRSVSDIDKWVDQHNQDHWKTGAPIHVKASIVYNRLLKETKLDRRFAHIYNGDKIKFVYLKTPNPVQNNAIAFIDFLHAEFNLDEYIDREYQFNVTFLSPLRSFTGILGWNTEKVNSLFGFFGDEDVVPVAAKETKNNLTVKEESTIIKRPKPAKPSPKRKTPPSLEGFF